MSAAQWLDIEKCKDLVAFEELEGRDVTCLIEISLLPTLKNAFGYRFFKKALIMMSALLALSIVNIFYKRGDGNMKDVKYAPLMILQKMQAGDVILVGFLQLPKV